MKTQVPLLIAAIFHFLFSASLAEPEIDTRVKAAFIKVTDSIAKRDAMFLDDLHPSSASALRKILEEEMEVRKIATDDLARITGLPQDFKNLTDADFLKLVFGHAIRSSPETFPVARFDGMHIHGVVQEGVSAFVVYSFPSRDSFKDPSVLVFRVADDGQWKLASLLYPNRIAKSWDAISAE